MRLACRQRRDSKALFVGVGRYASAPGPAPTQPLIRHVTFLRRPCLGQARTRNLLAGSGASLDPANTRLSSSLMAWTMQRRAQSGAMPRLASARGLAPPQ